MDEAERRLLAKTRNDLGRVIPASKSEIFDLKDRQDRYLDALVTLGGINYAKQQIQVPEDLFEEWLADPEFRRRIAENILGVLERFTKEVKETGEYEPEYIAERRGMVGALNNNRDAFYKSFQMMIQVLEFYPDIFKKGEDGKNGKGGNTYNMTIIVGSEKAREMVENAGERTRRLIEG